MQELDEKIFKLEERLMNNEIDTSTYQNWIRKFKEDKAALEYSLNKEKRPVISNVDELVERLLPELSNIHQIYNKSNNTQRQTLIRGVFKDNLVWSDGMFRIHSLNPIFYDRLLKSAKKDCFFQSNPS